MTMKTPSFGLLLGAFAGLSTAALFAAAPTNPPPIRPNVIFILADDLGWADTSLYGHTKFYQTPQLDRLAKRGMTFSRAFSASPLCSPTRSAVLTGLSPARTGITTPNAHLPKVTLQAATGTKAPATLPSFMPETVTRLATTYHTIPKSLKAAGYSTGHFGKWHLGAPPYSPLQHGFDLDRPHWPGPGPAGSFVAPWKFKDFDHDPGVPDQHIEDRMAKEAVAFMEENRDRPFFVNYWMFSVHAPFDAKKALIEKHRARINPADPQRSPTYAAMIESLDAAVGRILAALDEHGVATNTLVVFTSDNGGLHVPEAGDPPPTCNAPFRAGKGFLYEGGLRVPLILRLPGFAEGGRTIDAPVSTGDIAATICRLGGVAQPEPADFDDVSGALAGTLEGTPPRSLHWHQPHYTNQGGRPGGAIRRGDWKLVEHFESGRLELFNLAADPGETRDRSADEPARVAELRGRLEGWRRDVGARPVAANPRFDPAAWRACHTAEDVSSLPAAATALEMVAPLAAWRKAMDDASAGPPESHRGWILLKASQAGVAGEKLLFEKPPEKDTLGYWVNADDSAWWDFRLDEPGRYRVEVLQGCGAGQGGSIVELSAGDSSLRFTVEETGHFQRFVPREVGELKLPAGTIRLEVKAVSKKAAAVMDLRQVTLERVD